MKIEKTIIQGLLKKHILAKQLQNRKKKFVLKKYTLLKSTYSPKHKNTMYTYQPKKESRYIDYTLKMLQKIYGKAYGLIPVNNNIFIETDINLHADDDKLDIPLRSYELLLDRLGSGYRKAGFYTLA